MGNFFSELKRRNVFRSGVAYGVLAWVFLQVVAITFPALGVPGWVMTMVIVLIALGFPLTIFLAWFYEITPEGVKTQEAVDAKGITKEVGFGRSIDFVIIALLIVAVGWLVYSTNQAKQESLQKRAQAEQLVEFMIEKLKDPLDSMGNLQLLDAVGKEAIDYYASLDPSELGEDSLARRSRALHMTGSIEDLRGNLDQAGQLYRAAFKTTEELLNRRPDDPTRIFDHSQSTFYLGSLDWRRGNFDEAEEAFIQYREFANQLIAIDPENLDWQGEVGFANSNLGTLYFNRGRVSEAILSISKAHVVFGNIVAKSANPEIWKLQLAQTHAWLADSYLYLGLLEQASNHRTAQSLIYQDILSETPDNLHVVSHLIRISRKLAIIKLSQGDIVAAQDFLEPSFMLAEDLLEFDPENTAWVSGIISLHLDYGELMLYSQNPVEAELSIRKAQDMTKNLLAIDSTVLDWKVNQHYRSQILFAHVALIREKYPEGLEIVQGVVEDLTEMQVSNPTSNDLLKFLSYGHFLLGEFNDILGRPEAAKEDWSRVVDLLVSSEQETGLSSQDILVRAYLRLGRIEEAERIAGFFQEIGYLHPGFVHYWQKWNSA